MKRRPPKRWTWTMWRESNEGEPGRMNPELLPSLVTLESSDDGQLNAELRLARLRAQAALVRTLTDNIEHLVRPGEADALRWQIIEEMARLGCRLLEAAAWMKRSTRSEDSGVFIRRSAN